MERIKLIINKIKNNTKTELPKDVEWKEFFVGDILDCKTTNHLYIQEVGYIIMLQEAE